MTPFRPQWVQNLVAGVREAPEWIVPGLLPRGILALLSAYPKKGKSTLVSQLAVAVAQGKPFLGRGTQQGSVLYIVAEERQDDVLRRLRDFGMTDTDPIVLWSETASDGQGERGELQEFIREHGIVLVIVDTFASYLLVKDETNNSDVTVRLKPYVDIAHDTEATILFVHHERKNQDGGDDGTRSIRGGGAILGLADLSLQLQQEGGGTGRRLKIVGRYKGLPQSLKLDYQNDEYVSLGTTEEHTRKAQRDKIVAVLPTIGAGLTVQEAVKAVTGLKLSTARGALDDAFTAGEVTREGAGKKGDPFRYRRIVPPHESSDLLRVPTVAGAAGPEE
jgi:KaiC/GvpD/RAD55 family RecA-like ATPase